MKQNNLKYQELTLEIRCRRNV